MAITQTHLYDVELFIGLSTDTKPTGAGVGSGDQFYETDTGNWFMWNGSWISMRNPISTVNTLNSLKTFPAPTNITAATSDTAIASANPTRSQLIVSNDGTGKLYLLVDASGSGVSSATNFTYVVQPGATFVFPNTVSTARVRGIWSATGGSAGVTDIS